MKKNRFLLIALAISILLHVLFFVFAPELKSEINSSDYLKKITKISIFREDNSSAPDRNIEKSKIRNIEKKRAPNRNIEKSKSRNIDEKSSAPNRNIEKSKSRNLDEKSSAPYRNIEISKIRNIDDNSAPDRNIEISESRNIDDNSAPDRNLEISKIRNIENNSAPSRNIEISESRNDEKSGAPKTAGELAVIPKALNPKTPDYPESLEDEGIEGSVTLELLISKEGRVLKAKVVKSDHELFSESALRTVKKYKFSPGKLADGSSADSLIEFVIKFEISL